LSEFNLLISINKLTSLLGGHRELEPLLPIPNRTVKRLIANDSMFFACESRSLPSFFILKNPNLKFELRVFYCLKLKQVAKGERFTKRTQFYT
jgi:hypothetical protein